MEELVKNNIIEIIKTLDKKLDAHIKDDLKVQERIDSKLNHIIALLITRPTNNGR